SFRVFGDEIEAQDGVIIGQAGSSLSPEEIVRMDWLAGNVIGSIPAAELFKTESQHMIQVQGVRSEENASEVQEHENTGSGRS
ncbi:MAG: BMP family ABC transporter substrate-binding protein, partial [Eubacteriales bacterium]|nr:BMP family ABC transporter substrate-binding protein [Eubacteriales bacterium]